MSSDVLAPVPPRRSRTKTTVLAAIALVVTFAAGVLVGAVGDRIFQVRRGGNLLPRHTNKMMLNRLDRRLDLTDDQRARIGVILERRHARMNELWSSVRPQVEQEIAATNAEIERLLTPEQRAEFARMKMRMHKRRH